MRAYRGEKPSSVNDPALPWNRDDPIQGEAELTAQLRQIKDDPAQVGRAVELLTQIARAQSMQGNLTDAERSLDQADRQIQSTEVPLVAKIRAVLERGRLQVLMRTPMQAKARFQEVVKVAEEAGEIFHAIDAAQMMAVATTKKEKSAWTQRALEMATDAKSDRAKPWLGPLHAELGFQYAELLQHDRAMEHFGKAEAFLREEGRDKEANVARAWIGRSKRLQGEAEAALEIQREILTALESDRRIGAKEPGLGVVLEEIAECLYDLGKFDDAQAFFGRAYDILSEDEWIKSNESARISRLKKLGKPKHTPSS